MNSFRPVRWLRGRTVRSRIAFAFGAVFVALGALLLGLVYVLSRAGTQASARRLAGSVTLVPSPHGPSPSPSPGTGAGGRPEPDGTNGVIALTDDLSAAASQQVLIWSALALLISAVLAVAVGWWTAGRVLRPVHSMTARARRISRQNLHERIALEGPSDELKELADTLDALLSRLETSFKSQQRFIANASHELRTPLSGQRAAIQIGLEDPSPDELVEVREGLLAANRRSERIIDGLLTLARGERGIERYETFDLREVVDEELDAVQENAREHAVRPVVEGGPCPVHGDRVMIGRLVANLLCNAVLYNVPGGDVRVRVGSARLTVSNTGPVVEPAEVEGLFEPFRRGRGRDRRSDRGEGLGLSIVQAIAQAHEGRVTATANPGGGLTVTFALPSVPPDGQEESR
ncbi:sensor histidine kinase [Streptomyces olivoreticuli]|uniref:sensor histidine kinase n=1 Tax=Streptomyces olivoreticuli TaxID=68246 RepID=UPI001F087F80|nr:ATP-binding protein [Streptomyces olivoreticuli]